MQVQCENTFARLAVAVKAQKQWNDIQLAKALDIGPTYLSRLRNGGARPSAVVMARLQALAAGESGELPSVDPSQGTAYPQATAQAQPPTDFALLTAIVKAKRDWSDLELADALGVYPSYISQIRNGRRNAGESLMEKLRALAPPPENAPHVLHESPTPVESRTGLQFPNEIERLEAEHWARECGLPLEQFITECVRRYGQACRDQVNQRRAELSGRQQEFVPMRRPAIPEPQGNPAAS